MRIVTKNRDKVTKEEEAQLAKLHFHGGLMWRSYYHHPEAVRKVLMIKENGIIYGWAIVLKFIYDEDSSFHVFVNAKHRRKGLGTRLMKKAIKLFPRAKWDVSRHDRISEAFYDSILE